MDRWIDIFKQETKSHIKELLSRYGISTAKYKEMIDELDRLDWSCGEELRTGFFAYMKRLEDEIVKDRSLQRAKQLELMRELRDLLLNQSLFKLMQKLEAEWIKEKRFALVDQGREDPQKDAFALALSGGGIRSATFNLGLLQAFQHFGVFKSIDYLSTVSGGGYIGSAQTWLKFIAPNLEHPFGMSRGDFKGIRGKILAWLRDHGRYLTSGEGLGLWSLIAAYLSALLINLLVLFPIILLMVSLLYLSGMINPTLMLGIILLGVYALLTIALALRPVLGWRAGFETQRKERVVMGYLLMAATFLLLLGSISPFYEWVNQTLDGWSALFFLASLLIGGFLLALLLGRIKESKRVSHFLKNLLFSSLLALIFYSVLLGVFHLFARSKIDISILKPLFLSFLFALLTLAPLIKRRRNRGTFLLSVSIFIFAEFFLWNYTHSQDIDEPLALILIESLPFSTLLASYININYVGLFRFYRNRLMEAYFPWEVMGVESKEADRFLLRKMAQKDIPKKTPYHIINTNVNLVGSSDTRARDRGGDNFIFTPLFCGSAMTGYRHSAFYAGGNMNLATAMAISGAAVDPNSAFARSKVFAFFMSLLNIRLGYWIENPYHKEGRERIGLRYYRYIFKELLGRGLDEKEPYIHLADGGHFENLGLYELLRRGCRYIIVSDAGNDPNFTFRDLAVIIEMARVDFGAKIILDTQPLHPREGRLSDSAFIHGKIRYADGSEGSLIYIKTTMIKGLPEDLYSYRRSNPSFPDQTTLDQFFDEAQFEAYRELGYQIGKRVCGSNIVSDFRDLFKAGNKKI